jgi:hypothetical protein
MSVAVGHDRIEVGWQSCGPVNSDRHSCVDFTHVVVANKSRLHPTSTINQALHSLLVEELTSTTEPTATSHVRILNLARSF